MVRFKNRYIALVIDDGKKSNESLKLKSQELYNEIVNKVKFIHGIFGFTAIKPGLKVNYYNELTRIAILRVRHGPHKLVLSALPLINKTNTGISSVKILYVGATLHHCYKALLNYQSTELGNLFPELKLETELEMKSKVSQLIM